MAGITQIKIPLKADELTAENIKAYLPKVLSIFLQNKIKIQNCWKIFQNEHDILQKTRQHEDDGDINNKVITPHLFEMVTFKSGYGFGNPKQYTQTKDNQKNELVYLNRYAKDGNEQEIDKNVATYIYATGNGYYFIEPTKETIDSEYQSPYVIYSKMGDTCAKVYSSYNGNAELFDILVTDIDNLKSIVSVYTPNFYYEFLTDSSYTTFNQDIDKTTVRAVYNKLPLVEKYCNETRLGIVESCNSLQDAIDKLNSSSLDNVEDFVNQMMVILNATLGATPEEEANNFKQAKKNGVIVLNDKSPDYKADIKTLIQNLDYSGIENIKNNIKHDMYDCWGVPIPSTSTSVGGTKTGAVEKSSGYDNAYNRILDDYNSFLKADIEVLKRKLIIAKAIANSKVKNLYASEIEIKYNPNLSDNMATKAQAYLNFRKAGVPPLQAIQWCRISNDPFADAKAIEEYAEANKVEEGINTSDSDDIQNG